MNRLFWAPAAVADREAIYDFIEADNPSAALELDERFSRTAAALQEQPGLGRPGRVAGTREWVVHPHYVLVYRIQPDQVQVLRLLHTTRQWPERGT